MATFLPSNVIIHLKSNLNSIKEKKRNTKQDVKAEIVTNILIVHVKNIFTNTLVDISSLPMDDE